MQRITLEPGKRGGRPCVRGLRITVYDILSMLSSGMTQQEILDDFPELEPEDVLAVLSFAADREHKVYSRLIRVRFQLILKINSALRNEYAG